MDPSLNNAPQGEQQNGSATPIPMPKLETPSSNANAPLPLPQQQSTQIQAQHGHSAQHTGAQQQQPVQQQHAQQPGSQQATQPLVQHLAQQQPQHTEQRPPVSYPSSPGYPSPGLNANNNQYAYPPAQPQQPQVGEPYRESPTGSNGSLSLPSMRSLDPLQQQQQQSVQQVQQQVPQGHQVQQVQQIQQQQQHNMGSPLPPPNVAQMPYYHSAQTLPHPGHQVNAYPMGVSMPDVGAQNMRYALPPTDHRVMSGGRHKKEIKRRTKTGCLTCRKRRIKCDEQHPACRNCQKSKRECLGYDPIFKQQPGPPQIQPAPHTSASVPATITTSNPYGNQPSMLPGYGAMSYDPNMPGSAQNFDYSGTIDPALEAVQGQQQQHAYQSGIHASYDPHHQSHMSGPPPPHQAFSYNPADVARHVHGHPEPQAPAQQPPHSYYPSYPVAAPVLPPVSQPQAINTTYSVAPTNSTPSAPPKIVKIDDLLIKLPAASETKYEPTEETINEIRQMYLSIYIPGLESFLESRWFTLDGSNVLMKDPVVLEHFSKLLQQFMKASENNEQEMMYAYQIEVRVVWELAQMVRQAESLAAKEGEQPKPRELPPNGIPMPEDAFETAARLTVWSHLLSGTIAQSNPLANPIGKIAEHHKLRELDFWHSLGKFVTLPIHDNTPQASQQIDETLSHLRNLLDGRENRDVLYSVAVVRALGQRVQEYGEEEKVEGVYLDEQDARSKVVVAKRFVGDEAGRGTTNVIRRFCELACRALGIGMPGLVGGAQ